ncbi:Fcf1-domain-containing protein [Xylariaceae sp. FL1651]|nr:Fcf1-domain-containing protein [Xylariaceae sp. FL1651]
MPRAKRSKQYRKLMNHYEINFGFREPYQVICDSQFLEAAIHSKMDIDRILKNTVHGSTKLLITQCSMRHLYTRKDPNVGAVIAFAKTLERRRCGHHPSDYPDPLEELDCLHSVVDPKSNGVNKHHVCCAVNSDEVRSSLRNNITAVPLLYIRRSVLIMEPASAATLKARSRDEKSKFRAELKQSGGKRKREEEDTDDEGNGHTKQNAEPIKPTKKKKKTYGRKEPNPLSMKKRKDRAQQVAQAPSNTAGAGETGEVEQDIMPQMATSEDAPGRKRRRKHKPKVAGTAAVTENGRDMQTQISAGED